MLRRAATVGVLCVVAAMAAGDRLVLLDGRAFEGTVTVEGQTVRVEMAYGTLLSRSGQYSGSGAMTVLCSRVIGW